MRIVVVITTKYEGKSKRKPATMCTYIFKYTQLHMCVCVFGK